jgi:hypothetical protein
MYPYELTLTHQATGETTRETSTDLTVLWDKVAALGQEWHHLVVRLDPDRTPLSDGPCG